MNDIIIDIARELINDGKSFTLSYSKLKSGEYIDLQYTNTSKCNVPKLSYDNCMSVSVEPNSVWVNA